jgi:hypothetical protein
MVNPRSQFNQDTQISSSVNYDDGIANVATVAEDQPDLEGDLNVLRTLLKNLKGTAKWSTALSSGATLEQLRTDLNAASASAVSKTSEAVTITIPAETARTIPEGLDYVLDTGHKGQYMDVFYNGQLLKPDSSGVLDDGDYEELNTTTVKFHFEVEVDAKLSYIIRG